MTPAYYEVRRSEVSAPAGVKGFAIALLALAAGCFGPNSACAELHCVLLSESPSSHVFNPVVTTKSVITTMALSNGYLYWRESADLSSGSSIWALEVATGKVVPVFTTSGYDTTSVLTAGGEAWFSVGPLASVDETTYKWTADGGLQGQPWAPLNGILWSVGDGWAAFFLRNETSAHYEVYDVADGRLLMSVLGTTTDMPPPASPYVNAVSDFEGKLVLPWHGKTADGSVSLVQTDPWTGQTQTLFSTTHNLDDGFSLSNGVMTFLEGDRLWALRLSDGKDFLLSQPGWWAPWADQDVTTVYYLREKTPDDPNAQNRTTILSRFDIETEQQDDWMVIGPGSSYIGVAVDGELAYVAMVEQEDPPKSTVYGLLMPN